MEIYTEKKHAERLIKLLENPRPCDRCVAVYGNNLNIACFIDNIWKNDNTDKEVCSICLQFIDLNTEKRHDKSESWYPCHKLGEKEALKKSWIALEEKGYLDMDDKCDQCGEKKTIAFSCFTGQNICRKCLDSEDALLVKLAQNGQDIWNYEGYEYIPKMDGSNWIEKEKL